MVDQNNITTIVVAFITCQVKVYHMDQATTFIKEASIMVHKDLVAFIIQDKVFISLSQRFIDPLKVVFLIHCQVNS